MARRLVLVLFLVIPGAALAGIFGYYALRDWSQLRIAYQQYHGVVGHGANLETVFTAYAEQQVQRMNLFADGVWTLLSALLAGLGIHGLCTAQPVQKPPQTDHVTSASLEKEMRRQR